MYVMISYTHIIIPATKPNSASERHAAVKIMFPSIFSGLYVFEHKTYMIIEPLPDPPMSVYGS